MGLPAAGENAEHFLVVRWIQDKWLVLTYMTSQLVAHCPNGYVTYVHKYNKLPVPSHFDYRCQSDVLVFWIQHRTFTEDCHTTSLCSQVMLLVMTVLATPLTLELCVGNTFTVIILLCNIPLLHRQHLSRCSWDQHQLSRKLIISLSCVLSQINSTILANLILHYPKLHVRE